MKMSDVSHEYRLLSSKDFDLLYECFLDAFSDYEVSMQMSREQFAQRFVRDGVRLELSAGAFDEDKLVGFYMNAIGHWNGELTAYDAGTGVRPSHRGRGIAKELFAFVLPHLQAAGITQYLLEVLSSNAPAVALYRRLGFSDSRELAVLRTGTVIGSKPDLRRVSIRTVLEPDWELFESFWDGSPSWQNSIDAVHRITDETLMTGAYVDEECVGYGVVFRPSSNLMQLAVSRKHRRRGIGSLLLSALQREASEPLKVNNVDENLKGTLAFFEASGFHVALKQFEMIRSIL